MEQNGNSSIIDKITKLFRLADSKRNQSEAEAMLAMTKAKELMARYDISMSEVDATDDQSKKRIIITQATAYERKCEGFRGYEMSLARAIGTLCQCRIIFAPVDGGKRQLRFFGTTVDVAIATSLYPILLKTIRNGAREHYNTGWSPTHQAYANGFALQLCRRAADEVRNLTPQEQRTMALVVRDKKLMVQNEFDKLALRMVTHRPMRVANEEAFHRGRVDANKVNLRKEKMIE